MNLTRALFRLVLGRRLPRVTGDIRVPGLTAPVTIRRDKWGIPHIDAQSGADAWFGLGFCNGQDRAGQLETLLRIGRGTLAEVVGPEGLGLDRVSRRIGFRRAALAQYDVQNAEVKAVLSAFVAGVNAAFAHGADRPAHEFALLKIQPTPWVAADVLTFLKVMSFLLPSNWDVELARLRILAADGPSAVRDLDPAYPDWLPRTIASFPSSSPPADPLEGTGGARASADATALDRLAADLALFQSAAPVVGGGSNNWVIGGSRTASGKPLLANDPHLAPTTPPPWYLAHIRTPKWAVAGAAFAGAPGFPVGHNGTACWGCTAGLTDNTDLFLETLGPDGRTARQSDGTFASCEVVREVIRVKGAADVIEDVVVTPRGPVLSPVVESPLEGVKRVVSMRAVWLQPLPLDGLLTAQHATDFDSFRQAFASWPILPLNMVYADKNGTTGWQLTGQLPVRTAGHGIIPLPADAPGVGWKADLMPFDQMPFTCDPAEGFLATANNPPVPETPGGPFYGRDYCDGYRAAVIREELAAKEAGWTVADCQALQQNLHSKPWKELRPDVLALDTPDPDARLGLDLLRAWDGWVAANSPAAAVFELFVAEMCVRAARAKAPKAWRAALGGDQEGTFEYNLFSERRMSHLVGLVRAKPSGWFARSWQDEMADALAGVVKHLRTTYGPGPVWWQWGDVRPLVVGHAIFGKHWLLGRVFNLPPIPGAGDSTTVAQAAIRPAAPKTTTHSMPNLRAVFDTADWSNSRFVLCGGQSGNPFSPHHADLFALWQQGDGVPIAWTEEEVAKATVATLRLLPGLPTV
ncbi:penicillin acylase family protein [Fimbriiglobus ruber]|uniref:Penicillin acylase n=1 Tax=Fimbriiglobus ruber TaxID=1908690 RepID=A0A225DW55_9BACT|nr:penicillin acylase family protein [Fimbriiglobus ruber]OWK43794.1 Penicillin acylase [Fimbriiglobus ruber]